jgi:hypothetical protein
VEEEADDISARLSKANKLASTGVEDTMVVALETEAAACENDIAAKAVPYGRDLVDNHHGACWRIAHARQLRNQAQPARTLDVAPTRAAWVPTRPTTCFRSH